MAGTGPAPKPGARRPNNGRDNNPFHQSLSLPADGRKGDPPKWPLPGRMLKGEKAAWSDAWATPQAVAWERLGWARQVARYVRTLVRSEEPDAPASLLGEVRQLEDRLGLTPMAMLRLRWSVAADEVAEKRTERTERERPRLVSGG